jgi:hypothetical protein
MFRGQALRQILHILHHIPIVLQGNVLQRVERLLNLLAASWTGFNDGKKLLSNGVGESRPSVSLAVESLFVLGESGEVSLLTPCGESGARGTTCIVGSTP